VVLELHAIEKSLTAHEVRNEDPCSVCPKAVQIVFHHLETASLFCYLQAASFLNLDTVSYYYECARDVALCHVLANSIAFMRVSSNKPQASLL
jgi:hypothetical protein